MIDHVYDTGFVAADEAQAEQQLLQLLEDVSRDVRTFEEAGLLTPNRGLVVRTPGGAEYQLTIVKSGEGGQR